MSKRITIFGAGAWGTAIAQLLAGNGHDVLLWANDPIVAEEISVRHTNKKYASVPLHKNIAATTDLVFALENADWLVEAIPVVYLRSVFSQIAIK